MPETGPQRVLHELSAWTIVKVVFVFAAAGLLFIVRDILIITFVSLMLAALISPLADAMARRRVPRTLTVLGVYVIIVALFLVIIAAIVPPLLLELRGLAANFSATWQRFLESTGGLATLAKEYGIEENLRSSLEAVTAQIPRLAVGALSSISGVAGSIFSVVLVFVLTFYMTIEGEVLKRFIRTLAPRRYEPYVVGILTRVQRKLGDWLRAQLILSAVVAVLTYVGLLILGMPYALVLALLTGLLEFIPYAGPVLAAIPAIFLALAISPPKALLVAALYVLIQQTENHLLVPKITQRIIGVNPIVSILALLLGARLAGMLGVLIAIPIAASVSLLAEDFFENRDRMRDANA